jgi:hypothetical protein
VTGPLHALREDSSSPAAPSSAVGLLRTLRCPARRQWFSGIAGSLRKFSGRWIQGRPTPDQELCGEMAFRGVPRPKLTVATTPATRHEHSRSPRKSTPAAHAYCRATWERAPLIQPTLVLLTPLCVIDPSVPRLQRRPAALKPAYTATVDDRDSERAQWKTLVEHNESQRSGPDQGRLRIKRLQEQVPIQGQVIVCTRLRCSGEDFKKAQEGQPW